jgi:tetratricopeptide (TPR) repeat protein
MNLIEQVKLEEQAEALFNEGKYIIVQNLCEIILKNKPTNTKANELLAYIVANEGNRDYAHSLLEKSCKDIKSSAKANYYLGNSFLFKKNFLRAEYYLNIAEKKSGGFYELFYDLGVTNLHLKNKKALEYFKKSLDKNPFSAEAHYGIGTYYMDCEDINYLEAIEHYDRAISIAPEYAEAWMNKGVALSTLKNYQEAIEHYDRSISIAPEYAEAWANKAADLVDLRLYTEAEICYKRAITIKKNLYGALWNKGVLELLLGRFEIGWRLYENRLNINPIVQTTKSYNSIAPLLESTEDIKKYTKILVWPEQGYGDIIQFSRYVEKLSNLGAEVTFQVNEKLLPLFENLSYCNVITTNPELNEFDFQIPVTSLPRVFKTTINSIPDSVPYLTIKKEKISFWKDKIKPINHRPNVGIAISGNPNQKDNLVRSVPLAKIAPLADLANLYLLQTDVLESDELTLSNNKAIIFLGKTLNSFEDTGAVIENMDLVVSVCTSAVHLSGALGKKTILMCRWAPDWRWLLDREDSPWYPTLKIFRQESPGDWNSVITRVSDEISKLSKLSTGL